MIFHKKEVPWMNEYIKKALIVRDFWVLFVHLTNTINVKSSSLNFLCNEDINFPNKVKVNFM